MRSSVRERRQFFVNLYDDTYNVIALHLLLEPIREVSLLVSADQNDILSL